VDGLQVGDAGVVIDLPADLLTAEEAVELAGLLIRAAEVLAA
jgi:hypothetical protein